MGRNVGASPALPDAAPPSDATAGDARASADGAAGDATQTCVERLCDGRAYACGDCIDNDADGTADDRDLECLGPCDDDEAQLHTGIPGQNQANCRMDCYFDNDSGSGNDVCEWDHRCDPLSVAPDYPPSGEAGCEADPTLMLGTRTCDQARATQADLCLLTCLEITPPGCDCFGCCELPARSGRFVWVGKEVSSLGTCEVGLADDPMACPPCTPVSGCQNACDGCERCVGESAPPAGCAGAAP